MKNLRKSLLLIIALVAFGTTAWAQNNYIECSWDAENKTVVQNLRAIPYGTTSVTSSTTTLSGWHEVSGNVTINGNVICEGDARLILHDNAHLTIKGGLSVNKTNTNNSLTIYCQSYGDSMGKLTVTCDTELCNGIGGNLINSQKMPHGTITIHGGDIYTKGGPCAVGLGSIRSESSPITIFGGRVEAHAGEVVSSGVNELACSGIGIIGNGGSGASLIVYGGDVYAYGASDAAGIGGCDGKPKYLAGSDSDGGIINIYGGYVEAHGGDYGAGIGGGQNGNGGSVTINGGTVKAWAGTDAAGIGSGEQKEGAKNGGTVTINGGYVEAHGGKYGAGIGGGQDASGATVTVTGGTVNAYGGNDAAGIGSGEEVTAGAGTINGGTLTVTGGYVFADGTGWGAGIGGGEDATGANVTISGGTVIAWAGSDAGNKNGSAIGSEMGDGHRGTLHIGDSLMVHAGQDASHLSFFTAPERVPACYYRPYTRIEPCNHEGASYTIDGTDVNGTHTLHCSHCLVSDTVTHTFENGECTVCHVHGDISTASVYIPEYNSSTNTYSYSSTPHSTQQLVTGSTFQLPAPPSSHIPTGVRFVGWRVGSPAALGLNDPRVTENEEGILPAGSSYTIIDNVSFTPRYKTFHIFTTTGNWNVESNWCWNVVPDTTKEIVIAAEATVPANYTAQLGDNVIIDLGGSITIADGGQLIHPQDVQATLEKQVTGYTADDNGWFTIASPITGDYSTEGLVTDNYDLYQYHEPTHYWWNAKGDAQDDHSFNTLANGQGYLYANGTDKTLAFPGVMQGTGNTVSLPLSYTEDAGNLKGFNLLGNPFTRKLTSSDVIKIGTADLTTYYVAENGGELEVRNLNDTPIKPGQGFMVQATETGQNLVINQATRGEQAKAQPAYLCIEAGNETFTDRAYLQIGGGNTLRKKTLKDHTAQLSLQHEGSDWAATTIEMATGEMPVSFKATENGTYTFRVRTEGLEVGYLHLIDNMTGADVDLLATPTYTFSAKTTDYASRFKLVFGTNTEDGPSTSSGTFAFFSDGNIIVDGEGMLQVIDMMGRVIVSRDGVHTVSTQGMTPGVYVLRLINGDNMKTQKIVIQ